MNPTNPLSIIKSDHEKVKKMFKEYEDGEDLDKKMDTAEKISEDLAIHMGMEEDIFYPKIHSIQEGKALVVDGIREHNEIKRHILDIYKTDDETELDKHISKIKEIVLHHISEEEGKIFPIAEENIKNEFTKMAADMLMYKTRVKGKIIIDEIKEKFTM